MDATHGGVDLERPVIDYDIDWPPEQVQRRKLFEWQGEHIGRQRDSEQSKHHPQKPERHPRESGDDQEEPGGTRTDLVESERDSHEPEGNISQSERDSGCSEALSIEEHGPARERESQQLIRRR